MNRFIESYNDYNPKNNLDAKDFVENNLLRLYQMYNLDDQDDMSDDEKRGFLIEYFSKHPDEIKRYSSMTFGRAPNLNTISTNNIGGVIKYR